MLERVISGGQTGVDRAGLDAAMEVGIPVGGSCPRGRLAEDGAVPEEYPLVETASADYAVRTEQNVIDADGTLVINLGKLSGGTLDTVGFAERHGRLWLVVQLDHAHTAESVARWVDGNDIRILNIAGPRELKRPGVHDRAYRFLKDVFTMARGGSLMKVMIDLCIVPIGVGVSLSPYIAACEKVLAEAGLKTALHAYGTDVEGEWDAVFAAVKRCHEVVHAMGAPRITTTIKAGTRTDRTQTMEDKIASVQTKL